MPDQLAALATLPVRQRIAAARECADRLALLLAAIDRGELEASPTEAAQLQGAVRVLRTLAT